MRILLLPLALSLGVLACGPRRPIDTHEGTDAGEDPETVVVDSGSEAVIPESVEAERDSQVVVESAEVQSEREAEAEFADDASDGADGSTSTQMASWASEYDIPIVINPAVEQWIYYFETRGRPWMELWLARSGRFLPIMQATLEEHGLPKDLVYLAMIESGFSTRAYSRARAVGPWQFISSTGRSYGLVSDWWMDMRRDPALSTDAAARHLKDLHEEFGDWYLAFAAYNAGPGKIRRAILKYNTHDFWELAEAGRFLRSETKNYVPKLIAAALIAKHPEAFGFTDIEYHDPLEYETVTVPDSTGLDIIAQCAGVPVADIEVLNPALRRFCTPPGRKWEVRVPPGTVDKFGEEFAKIPENKRITFRRHVVRTGDTLSQIAEAYHTGLSAIMNMNGIHNARRLRAGQTLVIPVPAYRAPGVRVAQVVPTPVPVRQASIAPAPVSPPAGRVRKVHVMQPGETLWGISQLYGVSVRNIKRWNGIRHHRSLQAGRKITVYVLPETQTVSAPPPEPHLPAPAAGTGYVKYTVQPGDSIWGIAREHGADPIEVLKINGLSRRSRIHPGDVVKIPH